MCYDARSHVTMHGHTNVKYGIPAGCTSSVQSAGIP